MAVLVVVAVAVLVVVLIGSADDPPGPAEVSGSSVVGEKVSVVVMVSWVDAIVLVVGVGFVVVSELSVVGVVGSAVDGELFVGFDDVGLCVFKGSGCTMLSTSESFSTILSG